MLIGYARVSTDDQNLDLQKDELEKVGCKKIFTDKVSGVKEERAGLKDALSHLRKGDKLIVWKLDRLGRSLKHLITTIEDLNDQGIGFQSLQENIDTTTSGGKLVFHIFGALAEFERDLVKERTNAGLKAARKRGHVGGRKPAMTPKQVKLAKSMRKDPNTKIADICETLGVSRATLYRYIK